MNAKVSFIGKLFQLFQVQRKVIVLSTYFIFCIDFVGKPMTDINTIAYRKRIFDMISGNCLLQRDINVPKDVCKVCV